jgi:hypothetical protein
MSMDDMKQVTVAVIITADGAILPLVLIFKGAPNGCIVRTWFSMYPKTTITAANQTY